MREEETYTTFSLRDLYCILFRHKASIIILTFSVLLTVIVGVYIWPDTYEAKATMFIKMGRENVTNPTVPPSSQQQVIASTGLRREDINSEIEILKNRFVIDKVIKKLGIDFFYPEAAKPETSFEKTKYEIKQIFKKIKNAIDEVLYRIDLKKRLPPDEKTVLAIQKNLSAKQVSNSDVIEIKFRWGSSVIATKVLSSLIDYYLEHHSEVHRTSGGHEFFQKQVEIIGKRLKDSEDKLQFLKEKQKISSFDDQKRLLLEQITTFEASLKMTRTGIAESSSKISELKRQMTALIEEKTPGFDFAYKEAEKELLLEEVRMKTLNTTKEELGGHIESYKKDLERLNLYEMELVRLERQIQIEEENYQLYGKRLEETRISDILDAERIVNVRVIDPAASSFTPVKPKKLMIIGIGAVLSLIAGIGFAVFKEYFDHSVQTPEDIRRYLKLPLLASIREVKKR